MEEQIRKRTVVGPVLLIALGALVLVSNLGLLPWGVWGSLWRLWPVALVAWGLDLLIGRRYAWGSWAVLGVVAILLVVALTVQSRQPDPGWWGWGSGWGGGEPLEGQEVHQTLDGAKGATVSLQPGVSRLSVTGHSDSETLIVGSVQPYPGEEIERFVDQSGDQLTYRLRSRGPNLSFGPTRGAPRWDLSLNQTVPLDLRIDSGVGETTLDLSQLTISNLDVDTGVGVVSVTLPERGNFKASIDAGVGEVIVRIPKGLAAKIQVDKGLGAVKVSGDYTIDGGTYTSPGFDQATDRVNLSINGGVGTITVREIE